jgi:RimJ/RimL family protein N-acetyltransferase
LLEGKNVNLRALERDDIDFLAECHNSIDFWGEHNNPVYGQTSKSSLMADFDNPSNLVISIECRRFIIQKKDGTKIGFVWHFINQPCRAMEISCFLVPSERGKGYGAEAIQLMVDYLFLSKNIGRIQALTNTKNKTAQRVLEKTGFKIEGTIRKILFVRGVWTDHYLLSILREEWKEPKILTKTVSQRQQHY